MAVAVELSLHPLRWFRHTPGSMKYQQHQQGTDEAEAKLVGARRLLSYCDSPETPKAKKLKCKEAPSRGTN